MSVTAMILSFIGGCECVGAGLVAIQKHDSMDVFVWFTLTGLNFGAAAMNAIIFSNRLSKEANASPEKIRAK